MPWPPAAFSSFCSTLEARAASLSRLSSLIRAVCWAWAEARETVDNNVKRQKTLVIGKSVNFIGSFTGAGIRCFYELVIKTEESQPVLTYNKELFPEPNSQA